MVLRRVVIRLLDGVVTEPVMALFSRVELLQQCLKRLPPAETPGALQQWRERALRGWQRQT